MERSVWIRVTKHAVLITKGSKRLPIIIQRQYQPWQGNGRRITKTQAIPYQLPQLAHRQVHSSLRRTHLTFPRLLHQPYTVKALRHRHRRRQPTRLVRRLYQSQYLPRHPKRPSAPVKKPSLASLALSVFSAPSVCSTYSKDQELSAERDTSQCETAVRTLLNRMG